MFTIAEGDPFADGGMRLVGIFESHAEAVDFAETYFDSWIIVKIHSHVEEENLIERKSYEKPIPGPFDDDIWFIDPNDPSPE